MFDLQLFCGGSKQTTTRNIPAQTATEAGLQSNLANYATTGINNATGLLTSANNAIGNTYNPSWSTLSSNYNNTMSNVNNGYNNLTNGVLPTSYSTNRQAALNADLQGTIGNAINSLGSRGILNSSVTNNALNNISQNAANTLANQYSSDLSNYANLLSGQSTQAGNTLSNNANAQQSSYYQPSQLFSYANNNYSPASNLFNTMYSGRMGTAGTTTTQSGGTSGLLGNVLGSYLSSLW